MEISKELLFNELLSNFSIITNIEKCIIFLSGENNTLYKGFENYKGLKLNEIITNAKNAYSGKDFEVKFCNLLNQRCLYFYNSYNENINICVIPDKENIKDYALISNTFSILIQNLFYLIEYKDILTKKEKELETTNDIFLIRTFQIEEKYERIKKVNKIISDISAELDFEKATDLIVKELKEIYSFEGYALALIDNETQTYWYHSFQFPFKPSKELKKILSSKYPLDENGGRVASVIKENKHYYFVDVHPDDIKSDINKHAAKALKLKSALFIPFGNDNEVFGVLSMFGHTRSLKIMEDDIYLIKNFLQQISNVYRNAYLYTSLERKKKEIEKLYKIVNAINSSKDFDEILRVIISELSELYSFEGYSLAIVDWEKRTYRTHSMHLPFEIPNEFSNILKKEYPLTVEGGRTAQAVLENKSFYFKEVKPDDIKNKLSKIAVDIYKLKSMLIIPLDTYGEVFGVISLSTHDKILNLSDADITYIKSFLSQIATAFKTTYFSKLATEKKEQLVKINEFTKKVSSSLDIHDVLNTIISYLTEKFNFEGHIISIAYEDNPQKLNVLDVKIDTLDDNYIDLLKEYGFPLDVEENVIIKSYKTNEIVYLNDSNNENIENDVKEMMQVFNIKSTINIPISLDNKTIGVLTFYTFNNNEMDLTQDDIISLKGFTDQISVAIKNSMLYEKLQHQKKELETRNKIIENDIKMAKKIQESLLPKSNPIFIGFSFSSFYQPMEHLGGDFYDFITIDHENIGILLSDVSGHGVSAAFITSMIKSSLDMDKDDLISPAIFFKKLQKKMLPLLTDKYFTAIYGVLNRKTKTFLYSNAAHIPQLVLRSNENFVEKIILPSNFIGLYVSDTDFFEEKSITLNSNDKILLFTDGFIENMRIKDEKNNINLDKSYDFLSEIFIKHKKLKGDKLINKLILEAKNQNTEEGFFDDIALILIEVF